MELEFLECVANGYWIRFKVDTIDFSGNWSFTYNSRTLNISNVNNPAVAASILRSFFLQFPEVASVYSAGETVEVVFYTRPEISNAGITLFPEDVEVMECPRVNVTDCPPHCECARVCFSPICPTALIIYNLPVDTGFAVYIKSPYVYHRFLATTDITGTLYKQSGLNWNFYHDYFVYLKDLGTGLWWPECFALKLDTAMSGPIVLND